MRYPLTYFDTKGDTIKRFSTKNKKENKLEAKKGMNQFVWDMTYDGAERLDGMILWWASLDGPQAIPGTYKVSLKVNDEEYVTTIYNYCRSKSRKFIGRYAKAI